VPVDKGLTNRTGNKIENTDEMTWVVDVTFGDVTAKAFLSENIMPQVANDVLVVAYDKNQSTVPLIRTMYRAKPGRRQDLPNAYMCGAGEHIEPTDPVSNTEKMIRSIKEEIGDLDVLNPDWKTTTRILDLGVFNSNGRDPRYWKFQTTDGLVFGFNRKSESTSNAIILETPIDSNIVITTDIDIVEINQNSPVWQPIELANTIPDNKWMIMDHKNLFDKFLTEFKQYHDDKSSLSPYMLNAKYPLVEPPVKVDDA
jgi:hypothetical protein